MTEARAGARTPAEQPVQGQALRVEQACPCVLVDGEDGGFVVDGLLEPGGSFAGGRRQRHEEVT
jgi:hypothetical protein